MRIIIGLDIYIILYIYIYLFIYLKIYHIQSWGYIILAEYHDKMGNWMNFVE